MKPTFNTMKSLRTLLLFAILSLFISCKKSETTAATGEYYYQATIGGTAYSENIPLNNTSVNLEAGSSVGGLNDVVFSSSVANYASGRTYLLISKGVMNNYLSATNTEFKNFFAPGTYAYGSFGSNGMTINWKDPGGLIWSTDTGTADQTGSTIRIVSVTDHNGTNGTFYLKTTIEFNCKLYDGAGNRKDASGTFVGLFGKI